MKQIFLREIQNRKMKETREIERTREKKGI